MAELKLFITANDERIKMVVVPAIFQQRKIHFIPEVLKADANRYGDREKVASSNYSSDQLGNIVPGVLNYYDLPDLIKLVPNTEIEFRNRN